MLSRHKGKQVFLFSLILFLGLPAYALRDAVNKVEVEGSVEMAPGQNRASASRAALEEGLRKAVLEVMKPYLDETKLPEQMPMLQEKILGHAQDYVRNYQSLGEQQVAKNYVVKISADVWIDPVIRDLRLLGFAKSAVPGAARKIQLVVAQPGHYRLLVAFRKYLQEEVNGISEVMMSSLSKSTVQMVITLRADGTLEHLQKDLESKSFDGRLPKVVRVGDDRLEVNF